MTRGGPLFQAREDIARLMRDECAGLSRRIKEEQEARSAAEMEVLTNQICTVFQFKRFMAVKFTTRLLVKIMLCSKLQRQESFKLKHISYRVWALAAHPGGAGGPRRCRDGGATSGVPGSHETSSPQDPTVELCVGPYGGPVGGGHFRMSEVPL